MAELLGFLWTLIGIITGAVLLGVIIFAAIVLGIVFGSMALEFFHIYRTTKPEEEI